MNGEKEEHAEEQKPRGEGPCWGSVNGFRNTVLPDVHIFFHNPLHPRHGIRRGGRERNEQSFFAVIFSKSMAQH